MLPAHVQLGAAPVLNLRPHRCTRSPSTPQSSSKRSGSQSSATHTTSPPLAARMDIAHRPAQPPTGAAFYPISCSIRASGRPPRPICTARATSSRLARETRRKSCGAERHRTVEARGVFSTAAGMYRRCLTRCRRRTRTPNTSWASGVDIVTPAAAVEAPRTHQERDLARRRNGPAHSAASLVSRRHVPRVCRCGALLGCRDPLRHCNGRCAAGLHSRASILCAPPAAESRGRLRWQRPLSPSWQ